MRLAVLILALLPGLALAEDVTLQAPVTAAVAYPAGLTLTRRATADLPEGTHRLLLRAGGGEAGAARITLRGATLLSVSDLPEARVDPAPFLNPAQTDALAAAAAARSRLEAAQDAADITHAAIEAATARLRFWRSLTGETLRGVDPYALTTVATSLGEGVAAAQAAQVAARADLRVAEETVEEAGLALDQALRDLDATGAPEGPLDLLALTVAAAGGPIELRLEQDAIGGWSPVYEARLVEAESTLELVRRVALRVETDLPLQGIDLRLSTADLAARPDPSPVLPDEAILGEERPELARNGSLAMERALLSDVAPVALDGPVLTYAVPQPVDLPLEAGETMLTLDRLRMPVRLINRAVPRRDAFAYLVAEAADGPSETLLPGPVTLFRGEAQVGRSALPLTPSGAALELGFGPRRDLPLNFVLTGNEEGERGVFATSGTRRQTLALRVRNLSDAAERVEMLHALPYSEQEALDVTVRAAPPPDAREVGDMRGVARWDLDVPAGAEAEVSIRIEATWPEGQVLFWEP